MTDKRKDGQFLARPIGAAPLFDSRSGAEASNKRWKAKEDRNKQMEIDFAEKETGRTMTYDEAHEYVVLMPQFRASREGKTAAAKFIAQLTGETPDYVDAKIVTDARQVTVNIVSFPDVQAALGLIEELTSAGKLVAAARIKEQIEAGSSLDRIEIPID